MKIYIKNMVCSRCIYLVQQELTRLGLPVLHVGLGEAEIKGEPDPETKTRLVHALRKFGFEIIDDKKSRLIGKIKNLVIRQVENMEEMNINYSAFLADKLNHEYGYLSSLFSSVEGTTIEKFIIETKIEKAKELLVYDEFNLTEIADKLGYSSVAHLSNQFKKVTGLSPSHFKNLRENKRIPLDKL